MAELAMVVASTGWLDWYKFPAPGVEPRYGHPSTNRARRRVTSLIWPTSLPTTPNRHQHANSAYLT